MSLQVAASQFALHKTSKQISKYLKDGSQSGLYGVHTVARYRTTSDKRLQPVIPSKAIFGSLTKDTAQEDEIPSPAECAVHLEFLAVLHELHQHIVESEELDEAFNIKPNKRTVIRMGESVQLKDDTLLTRRQAKWDKYLELAVVRFITWMKNVRQIYVNGKDKKPQCVDGNLPPLDILMVWHSFLLNPRWFRKYCREGITVLYRLKFPWALIHQRINPDNWNFSLSTSASTTFQEATKLAPNLLESLLGWESYDVGLRRYLVSYVHTSQAPDAQKTAILRSHDDALLQQIAILHEEPMNELKEAVIRQVGFVDKMWDRSWIRSPALEGTIRRALERYQNFLSLFKLYPTTMFVPTLDIDLVWHTHQCSPERYYKVTQEVAGKFVNHDDSIVQDKLDTGMKDTQGRYRIRFGREYHICGCWDCEALQSAIEEAGGEPNLEAIANQLVLWICGQLLWLCESFDINFTSNRHRKQGIKWLALCQLPRLFQYLLCSRNPSPHSSIQLIFPTQFKADCRGCAAGSHPHQLLIPSQFQLIVVLLYINMTLLKQLRKPKVRASVASTLVASNQVPNSGLTFVDNSQGCSAAVAELSSLLDIALDQFDCEGEPSDQLQLQLKRLANEAAKYTNSTLNTTRLKPWNCSRHEAQVISIAFECAAAAYEPELLPSLPNLLFKKESYIPPSIAGTTKATCIYTVTAHPGDSHFNHNPLIPLLVVAIRGTASRVDRIVNLNGESRELYLPNLPENQPPYHAHAGFLNAANDLEPLVSKKIKDLSTAHKIEHVLFTGHSAGGAVASLLFLKFSSQAEINYPTLSFSTITFGAPPVIHPHPSLPLMHNPNTANKPLTLSLINEYDLVTRTDGTYIRSLVDLYRSIYDLDPISSNSNSTFTTTTTNKPPTWSLPTPTYTHVGEKITLVTEWVAVHASTDTNADADSDIREDEEEEEEKIVFKAFELGDEDFSALLWCNVSVHRRARYRERVEGLFGGGCEGA